VWFKKSNLLTLTILILFVFFSMRLTEFDLSKFKDFRNMIDFLSQWFPMDFSLLPDMVQDTLETLAMAFLGSVLGLVIALPISFIAARNTSPSPFLFQTSRIVLSFVRSIPEIVFGLILLTT